MYSKIRIWNKFVVIKKSALYRKIYYKYKQDNIYYECNLFSSTNNKKFQVYNVT